MNILAVMALFRVAPASGRFRRRRNTISGYNGQRFSGCRLNVEKRKAPPEKLPRRATAPAGLSGRAAEANAEAVGKRHPRTAAASCPAQAPAAGIVGLARLTADKSSFSLICRISHIPQPA